VTNASVEIWHCASPPSTRAGTAAAPRTSTSRCSSTPAR
jgi:hypothetical protein